MGYDLKQWLRFEVLAMNVSNGYDFDAMAKMLKQWLLFALILV